MPHHENRRTFLKHTTAAGVALGLVGSSSAGAPDMTHFICVTCGMQYAATAKEPDGCPICLDERQYVGHAGQKWTTLGDYTKTHKNVLTEEEADLHSILPQPKAGIGQRAFLVRTKEGNVLWDCDSDSETRTPTRLWIGAMTCGATRAGGSVIEPAVAIEIYSPSGPQWQAINHSRLRLRINVGLA